MAPVFADTPAPSDTPAAGETAQSDSAGDIADDLTEPLADRLGATLRETLASLFPPVWRDPGSVAATAGLGATSSLTQELHAPMAWAWRWMLTVPDSIQPDPGSAMDRAFAGVPGGAVLKDFFVPSKANQALRAMWERTRDLALNARTPLISLVVAIFVGFALYKVFMGAPVDLRAFAGQTVVAVGFALASYVIVEAMLQLNNLLVQAFVALGGDVIDGDSPLELFERWGWGTAGTGGVFAGLWTSLFRTLLYLVLLLEVVLLATEVCAAADLDLGLGGGGAARHGAQPAAVRPRADGRLGEARRPGGLRKGGDCVRAGGGIRDHRGAAAKLAVDRHADRQPWGSAAIPTLAYGRHGATAGHHSAVRVGPRGPPLRGRAQPGPRRANWPRSRHRAAATGPLAMLG